MIITIIDKEGILQSLKKDYEWSKLERAEQFLIQRFQVYAEMVFSGVLGKEIPKKIELWLVDDNERENSYRAGAFIFDESREKRLVFEINKITLEHAIVTPYSRVSSCVILHEILHAADYMTLKKYHKMSDKLEVDGRHFHVDSGHVEIIYDYRYFALLAVLKLLNYYRAEGVAKLGEHLLTYNEFDDFDSTDQALGAFSRRFVATMHEAQRIIKEQKLYDDGFESPIYDGAQILLLKVLGRKGDVDEELEQRVLKGLETGHYEMTKDEAMSIVRAALLLSLEEYIYSLLQLGDEITPVHEFFETWALSQNDEDKNHVEIFMEFLRYPKTVDSFIDYMQQIVGGCTSEENLDVNYAVFCKNLPKSENNLGLKEKLDALYMVLKNDESSEKRQIAHWALTYFFYHRDVIHDDLEVFGLFDDMMVIDRALKAIEVNP